MGSDLLGHPTAHTPTMKLPKLCTDPLRTRPGLLKNGKESVCHLHTFWSKFDLKAPADFVCMLFSEYGRVTSLDRCLAELELAEERFAIKFMLSIHFSNDVNTKFNRKNFFKLKYGDQKAVAPFLQKSTGAILPNLSPATLRIFRCQ